MSLLARNRSPEAIQGYIQTVDLFRRLLVDARMPTGVNLIQRNFTPPIGHVDGRMTGGWKPGFAIHLLTAKVMQDRV
jgi:hypothetical protein